MKVYGIDKAMRGLVVEVQAKAKKEATKVASSLVEKLKKATPVDTGKAQQGWHLEGNKIVNDTEYISALNEGHSDQAPARFIEATLLADPRVKPAGIIVKYTHTEG